MNRIEVKILNPDSIDQAEKMMVCAARLTQRGHQITCLKDFMELYESAYQRSTVEKLVKLPHPTIQKFGIINVVIVGASRRFLAQITRHQNEVKYMSASLQYSDYIHNHIIWNSTDLNCTRKFRNIIGSFLVVQRISDQLCLEHGLSVIKPRPYKDRTKYEGYQKRKTLRSEICDAIDIAITKNPRSFDELLLLLEEAGFEIKRGKYVALRGEKQKRFARMDSLGTGYTEADLRSIFDEVQHEKQPTKPKREFDLLIDIQEKLAQGKGRGYENWAKVYNVKQMAQTLLFLQQNGIREYSVLEEKTKSSSARFEELSATIKSAEKRLAEIAVLKTHIINYSKTRDVYVAYRKSGYSKKFFEAHREEITLHKAAKEAFNALSESKKKDGKLPTVKQLSEEYARVLEKKKKAYSEYREAREEMKKYTMAKHNIDEFMRKSEQEEQEQKKKRVLSR